ncbi:MAG TPA: DedA family protein, partial [Terriglobia bacterium]|nr:DedA family protein [Terriglobia bacterium]
MAHTIFQTLSEVFSRYGYWVVFFGVMLENAGIPVPGETVLLFAGFLAYHGKIELLPSILVAIAGATLGDSTGFLIGHFGGRPFVDRFIRRFPVVRKSFDHSQTLFLKYGQWAVFTGRFITGLRMFAGIIAGLFRMPYLRFLFFNFTGATIWVIAIIYVGFLFGNSWQLVEQHFLKVNEFVMAAVLVAVLIGVISYYFKKKWDS